MIQLNAQENASKGTLSGDCFVHLSFEVHVTLETAEFISLLLKSFCVCVCERHVRYVPLPALA